jgi:hypothetical protein
VGADHGFGGALEEIAVVVGMQRRLEGPRGDEVPRANEH